MDTPLAFTRQLLEALTRALADEVLDPLMGHGSLEVRLVESISSIHQRIVDALPSTERRQGLAHLIRMPSVLAEAHITDMLAAFPGIGRKEKFALASYLQGFTLTTRQRARRLEDPKGKKLPASWTLEDPEDLLGLLPTRPIHYRPGQTLGHYALLRFMGADSTGECWKASRAETAESAAAQAKRENESVDSEDDGPTPFVMRLILKESLIEPLKSRKAALKELAEGEEISGMAHLRKVKVGDQGAMLAWDHVDGVPFHGGEGLWELPGGHLDCPRLARWIRRAAQVVGKLHTLAKPVVHGGLCPTSVYFSKEGAKWRIRIADIGWADLEADRQLRQEGRLNLRRLIAANKKHGIWRALYTTPQRRKGAPAIPSDDTFALGLLWYQAVMGSWDLPPPSGLDWVDKALGRGVSAAHGRILGRCLAPEPGRRFATGTELADELEKLEGDNGEKR